MESELRFNVVQMRSLILAVLRRNVLIQSERESIIKKKSFLNLGNEENEHVLIKYVLFGHWISVSSLSIKV